MKISCDLTGVELDQKAQEHMTVCSVIYKKIEDMEHKGDTYKIIRDIQSYELHISAEKSAEFMERLKQLLEEMKEA